MPNRVVRRSLARKNIFAKQWCIYRINAPSPATCEPVPAIWETAKAVKLVWIHRLPDYVLYNHAAHVNRGISCAVCHGQVTHMSTVYDAKPMRLAWCLECHRHPENFLRPEDQI